MNRMNREESFQIFYELFKKMYEGVYSEEEIVDKVNWLLDKQESLPKSKESITVKYYDFLIDVDEIEAFREVLQNSRIELGHYNKSGDIHQAFELPDISIIINDPIVIGVAANLATELIKTIYRKIREKKITSIRGKRETVKAVSFEIEIKESENKKSQFRIKGELNDNQIDKLIEKIPEISSRNDSREVKEITELTKQYKPNENNTDWEENDLLEEIRRAHELQQKSKGNKKH